MRNVYFTTIIVLRTIITKEVDTSTAMRYAIVTSRLRSLLLARCEDDLQQ